MALNITGLPDTAAVVPQLRTVAQAVAVPAVNDAAAFARQQTVVAPPAPALVPGYNPQVAAPPKPVLRNPQAVSSSTYAAQYIGQNPNLTTDELQLFVTAPPAGEPQTQDPEDDFLADLRAARDEVPSTPSAAAKSPTPSSARVAPGTNNNANSANPRPAAALNVASANIASIATSAPSVTARAQLSLSTAAIGLGLTIPTIQKKPTIAGTRGLPAYALTELRNAHANDNRDSTTLL